MIQRERGKRIMNNEEGIVRLAKPIKRSLLRLVFSRFFVIALLAVLQILILIAAYAYFTDKLPILINVMRLFSLGMVIYLFNCKMDSSAKLTWMFIIAVLPLAGAAFLLFTQSNIGHRVETKLVDEQIQRSRGFLEQPPHVLEKLEHDGSGVDDLCRYLNRSGCFPLFDGTAVRYFPLGEDMFEAMLEELEKAEKFIFLEFFIIQEGYMWGRILDILTRKAKEGVEIRVLYDGMCEMFTLPVNYWKLLEKVGIKARPFSAIRPVVSSHYNYRDHRKILVIDGKVAFNGGVNLADEYINRIERFGHWKDTAVMLKGPAVQSFTLMFLQMWNVTEKDPDYGRWLSGLCHALLRLPAGRRQGGRDGLHGPPEPRHRLCPHHVALSHSGRGTGGGNVLCRRARCGCEAHLAGDSRQEGGQCPGQNALPHADSGGSEDL